MRNRFCVHNRPCLLLLAPLLLTSETADSRPIRVLPPVVTAEDSAIKKSIGLYLAQRLAECEGAEAVDGSRATLISQWLASPAFVLTDAQRWDRVRSFVDVDAILRIKTGRSKTRDLSVVVFLQDASGVRRFPFSLPYSKTPSDELPKLASEIGSDIGKALGLPGNDLRLLAEVRIKSGPAFQAVYQIQALPVITSHRALGETAVLLSPEDKTQHHRELDLAALRLSVGVITAKLRTRSPSLISKAFLIGRKALFNVLGTPEEEAGVPFAVLEPDDYTAKSRRELEKLLIEVARPLVLGARLGGEEGETPPEIAELEEDPEAEDEIELGGQIKKPSVLSSRLGSDEFNQSQREGAVRMLGLLASADALPMIVKTALRDDAAVRRAAACALAGYSEEQGLDALQNLAEDKDVSVSFLALRSLRKRGAPSPDLKAKAASALGLTPVRREAARIVCSLADEGDVALLRRLASDRDRDVVKLASSRLLSLGDLTAERVAELLRSADAATVVAAIGQVKLVPEVKPSLSLVRLANDPHQAVAWAARDRLRGMRPAEGAERARFDLAVAHFYVRQKTVRELADSKEPWADGVLAAACENPEPHTRSAALKALAGRAPERARPLLTGALEDEHQFVRLTAAAELARHATAREAAVITEARELQTDEATKLYLDEALARARGTTLPKPRPSARTIHGTRNLAWLCGAGNAGECEGAITSPYDAYYMMGTNVSPRWQNVYRNSKKIIIGRASPIADPGPIMTDPVAQDRFWITLDAELTPEKLPFLDGVVYGEESMKMTPMTIWPSGWKLFCEEAGLDPSRVRGAYGNLNPYEQRAWTHWAMQRIVEGFNRLYDYTKLKCGKLRPGFQVATFLGEQGLWAGPNVADFEWKFDVGGIYHYFGDARKNAYALVRRYKTIWPDRPVVWLSHGIGVYERTPVKFNHKPPTGPVSSRYWRCYRDSMTAWLAGADTGWFSIWGFMDKDYKGGGIANFKGPTITPEEFSPRGPIGSALLDRCIDHAFAGVEEMRRNQAKIREQDIAKVDLTSGKDEDGLDLDDLDTSERKDTFGEDIQKQKAKLKTGFFFYRKYLYDLARLFRSLPRNTSRPDALVVHPIQNVWYGRLGSPGSDLLTAFDFLIDINKVKRLDLGRYQVVAVHDPGRLEDATIAALTGWLRTTPGLLYVHVELSSDNADQSATPQDFGGKLKLDWPWEEAVKTRRSASTRAKPKTLSLTSAGEEIAVPKATVASSFGLSGDRAHSLALHEDRPVAVLWADPDFKGAVIFDGVAGGGAPYRQWLLEQMNRLAREKGIGKLLAGPIRQELLESPALTAASASGSAAEFVYPGPDLVTGWTKHPLGPGSGAAFLPRDMASGHIGAGNGIAVLSETPDLVFEKVADGVKVRSAGLLHAVSATGAVEVQTSEGKPLPTIEPSAVNEWILRGDTPGVAVVSTSRRGNPGSITYIRHHSDLTLKKAPAVPGTD